MNKNTFKTFVLLAGLGGAAVAIGGLFGAGGAMIGFAIGLAMVGGSYWFSDKLALKAAGAKIVEEHEAPELYGIVRSLADRAGMPMPRVALSPAMQPNAFATGRSPGKAVVCATQGLLTLLPRDEVEGVMAHELSHVRHNDILIGSVAAAIATGISFISQMAMFSAMFGGRDREDANPMGTIVVAMVAPIAAGLIQASISRSREFDADRAAARLLGDGESLARALERIESAAARTPMAVPATQASAWIHNPLAEVPGGRGQQANARASTMARRFSTHPPTEERIRRLREREWAR